MPYFDETGEPTTSEGPLLRALTSLRCSECARLMSTAGSNGMGGAGKATALRALCHQAQVRNDFPNGICFMEFEKDAKDRNVLREVKRSVTNPGGHEMAKNIEEDGALEGATDYCREFLKGKLFYLCAMLFSHEKVALNYLPELKNLLVTFPKAPLDIDTGREHRTSIWETCGVWITRDFRGDV